MTYHRFISFSLYTAGLVGFVCSLVKKHYLKQFTLVREQLNAIIPHFCVFMSDPFCARINLFYIKNLSSDINEFFFLSFV